MTWNGIGGFNPPVGPEFPAVADELIRADYYNAVIQALSDAFDNVLPRDGQAPVTGPIDFAGLFQVKNLVQASQPGQAVRFQEFDSLSVKVDGMANGVEPLVYFGLGII